jgi:hypothetical protein
MLFSAHANILLTDFSKPIIVSQDHPTVSIALPGQAGTGYQWFLSSFDPRFITPISFSIQKGIPPLMGGKNNSLFTLQFSPQSFIVPMRFEVGFVYQRSFENTVAKTLPLIFITEPAE